MALGVSPMVSEVADIIGKLRADDSIVTDGSVVLGDVEQILNCITVMQSLLIDRLRTAVELDLTTDLCGRSTRAWLIEEQLLSGAEAGRYVRLARQLPDAPLAGEAMKAGAIGTGHATAVLSALTTLPADLRETVEPHLVERARTCPPEEIAGFTDELLDALGLDKTSDVRRERRHASRGLDFARTMDGAWALNGTLTPEVGAKFNAALQAAGITTSNGSPGDDDRTPRQRRHDALGILADGFLAAAGAPPTGGSPRSVIVTMTLETLEGRLSQAPSTLTDGTTISPETARRLACDAALIPVVLNGAREVIDIGRPGHDFPVAVRRAAWVRDGGRCAYPGCRNRVSELHHIRFRKRDNGPSSLDNAAWLCTYHHYLAHEGGWRLRRNEDGYYEWTNRRGVTVIRRLGADP